MIYKYRRWKGMDSKMKKALPYIKSLIFIVGLIVIIGVCDYCFAKTGYIHYILQQGAVRILSCFPINLSNT